MSQNPQSGVSEVQNKHAVWGSKMQTLKRVVYTSVWCFSYLWRVRRWFGRNVHLPALPDRKRKCLACDINCMKLITRHNSRQPSEMLQGERQRLSWQYLWLWRGRVWSLCPYFDDLVCPATRSTRDEAGGSKPSAWHDRHERLERQHIFRRVSRRTTWPLWVLFARPRITLVATLSSWTAIGKYPTTQHGSRSIWELLVELLDQQQRSSDHQLSRSLASSSHNISDCLEALSTAATTHSVFPCCRDCG